MTNNTITIAVDGPAASGKGTLSRRLARYFGLNYLDTGSLYRAVALIALNDNIPLDDETALSQVATSLPDDVLSDPRLREPGVGEAASKIASLIPVRETLLRYQRDKAETAPGAVLDGRDIGTVVCPDADVKLFVTASSEVRAERRYKELLSKGQDVTYDDIFAEIERRDARDSSRSTAPLIKAADAHLLDTTNLDIEKALDAAVYLVNQAIKPEI
ncbi:MAG: cytidylate kinase [Methyloligella sp.]|nr:MAG: cytidylate kinase [Methyloligella sp.]